MERLKQMKLKTAFFCLTILFLVISLVLSALSIYGIGHLIGQFGTSLEMKIDSNSIVIPPVVKTKSSLPPWYHLLEIAQFMLPVCFVVTGLLAADLVFYRIKLKKPLAQLHTGAERIMQNDLDFTLHPDSDDELGGLCTAFEEMRLELLKNNRENWSQMEERKRLNAAFSHDLRNPVTVLKGSARMLKKGLLNENLTPQSAAASITLIEEYTERIESYIEAMSSIQRLEQLQCSPRRVRSTVLIRELSDSIQLLGIDSGIRTEEEFEPLDEDICIDKAMLFNVAENLIANAMQYASERIKISLNQNAQVIELSVLDDGPGFSKELLQKGAAPFYRGEAVVEAGSHFGMGLYVCRLFCEKHGGFLLLKNTQGGAEVTASFQLGRL